MALARNLNRPVDILNFTIDHVMGTQAHASKDLHADHPQQIRKKLQEHLLGTLNTYEAADHGAAL